MVPYLTRNLPSTGSSFRISFVSFPPRKCDSLVNVFISMDKGTATVEASRAPDKGKHEREHAVKEMKGGFLYARTRRGTRS